MRLERPGKRLVLDAGLAVGSGVALGLCFGRQIPLALTPVAMVPWLATLDRPRPFLRGWLFGVALWGTSMPWLIETVHVFGGLPEPLAGFLFGLLILYLGLDQAVYAWVGARIWRRGTLAALLGLPALWVLTELARGFPFGGFPWNLAAYAWTDLPGALALSAWVGAFGVSFLLVFTNVVLALAWRWRRARGRALGVAASGCLAVMLLLVLAGRFGDRPANAGEVSGHDPRLLAAPPRGAEVRIVQPNNAITDASGAWTGYQRLLDLSAEACEGSPGSRRLLVWPESAAFPFRYDRSERLRRDLAELSDRGCDVLFGSVTASGTQVFNSSLLLGEGGLSQPYSKRRLVPWGEYVPLRDVFSFVGTLARNAGDFTPGTGLGLLPWGEERIGMAICYEVVFPAAVAAQVRGGASVLATITNDAWYGDTAAPWQHYRAARFRAAENRRPMIRAALTGVSGLIDSRGAVGAELTVGERGVIAGRVHGGRELTLYSRAPWLFPVVCVLLVAFVIVRPPRTKRA